MFNEWDYIVSTLHYKNPDLPIVPRLVEVPGAREKLEKAFTLFDADNSGTIDAKELIAILTKDTGASGKPLSMEDAQEMIQRVDINGDGVLDIDEFCELMGNPHNLSDKATATAARRIKKLNITNGAPEHNNPPGLEEQRAYSIEERKKYVKVGRQLVEKADAAMARSRWAALQRGTTIYDKPEKPEAVEETELARMVREQRKLARRQRQVERRAARRGA